MLESQWQRQVTDVADRYQWKWLHIPQSAYKRRASGLIPGWPDLVLLHERRSRVVFAELKTRRGVILPDQRVILGILARAGLEVALWRPGDIASVIRTLGPRNEVAGPAPVP